MIAGLWMEADEASIDMRSKRVCNDSVSVSVPSKDLKLITTNCLVLSNARLGFASLMLTFSGA